MDTRTWSPTNRPSCSTPPPTRRSVLPCWFGSPISHRSRPSRARCSTCCIRSSGKRGSKPSRISVSLVFGHIRNHFVDDEPAAIDIVERKELPIVEVVHLYPDLCHRD